MRVLLPAIFLIFISGASYADTDLSPLMSKADKGAVEAQSKLGWDFYHGWDGQRQNRAEAYFWFSVCAYHASAYTSVPKEELQKKFNEAITKHDEYNMSELMTSMRRGQISEECSRMAEKSKQEAAKTKQVFGVEFKSTSEIDERISTWKSQHPLVKPETKTAQQIEAEKSGFRLFSEATGPSYDLQGIDKLIKSGAVISTDLLLKVAAMGRTEVLRKLVDAGGDINGSSLEGVTPLSAAVRGGSVETVDLLIQRHAALDLKDVLHHTPLLWAAEAGKADIVRELAKAGADTGATDSLGRTALMIAAERGSNEVLAALIERGVDVNSLGNQNDRETSSYGRNSMTALDFAVRAKRDGAIKILIAAGGKSTLPAPAGSNPAPAGARSDVPKCTGSAKTCPDGSVIHPEGAQCLYPACPAPTAQAEPVVDESPAMALSRKAVEVLRVGEQEQRDKVIDLITQNPGIYDPRALNAVSTALFHKLQDDEGAFWYFAAEMRAQYDRFICPVRDSAFRTLMGVAFSPSMEAYQRQNPEKVRAFAARLVAWDRATPSDYDHQWAQKTPVSVIRGVKVEASAACLSKERAEAMREESQLSFAMKLAPPSLDTANKEMMAAYFSPLDKKWNMDELKAQAESGDKKAQFKLSHCYMVKHLCQPPAEDAKRREEDMKRQEVEQKGKLSKTFRPLDITQGYDELSMTWLTKSAAQGYEPALMAMADRYFSGKGVPKDQEKSRAILLEVARRPGYEANAYAAIGDKYMRTPDPNPVEGFAWLSLAESYRPELLGMRLKIEATLTDDQLAEARKLAETYRAKYHTQPK